ncbi:MAG: phosphatase PAP2 family protein [Bacteroidota bacterium]
MDSILQFDRDLFLLLNGMHTPWWDTVMLFITRKETWLFLYLMLIYVIARNYEKKSWIILLVLLAGFAVSDQFSTLIKELTQRYRPGHEPALEGLVHIVLRKGSTYGFVSSHASNTFFVLAFTAPLFRNRISFLSLLTWAMLVSYSRIYNGNHYPLDVISGGILGIALGILFYKILIFIETRFFITKTPRFEKTGLRESNAGLILLTVSTILGTMLMAVYILHKYNYL